MDRPHLWGCYNNGMWEYIDTAISSDDAEYNARNSKDTILREYRMAYGVGWKFRWSNKEE